MKTFEELETPFYMIDVESLMKNHDDLKEAMNRCFKKSIIGYSYKTNSLPWIIKKMKTLGCYAEVVSSDEYELAKKIGYTNQIIYNGPIKDKETFLEAVQDNAIVNIETKRELQWLSELPKTCIYNVGLRINFDIERHCPNESACGKEGGRFGFCIENDEFTNVLEEITKFENIHVKGIHLHTSSKTRSIRIYEEIAKVAVSLIKKYSLNLAYIDIGGGFYGGMPSKPSFYEYMSSISCILSELDNLDVITIIAEPGAALIASPISFHTSVIDVKKTNRNIFVTTDGSRNDIDPLMQKNSYLYEIIRKSDTNKTIVDKQTIAGYTCMEHDRLFSLKDVPLLNIGDRIIYKKVGSYTMCLSPLFIKYFPAVYILENGKVQKVRERWCTEEYMQKGDINL